MRKYFRKYVLHACAGIFVTVAVVSLGLPFLAHAGSLIDIVVSDTADGNLAPGDSLRIYFGVGDAYKTDDFVVNGPCTVNGRDVSSSFTDATDGTFYVEYVVNLSDATRAPGAIPFSCALKDVQNGGTETVNTFTVPTQVSINWSGDNNNNSGSVDTSALSNAVTSAQSSLKVAVVGSAPGDYPQVAIDAYRTAVTSAQTVLNDLTSTQNDIDAALTALNSATSVFNAAKIPNPTGGGSNPGDNNNPSVSFSAVTLEPDHSVRSAGYSFLINMQAGSDDWDMAVDGPCTVNGVDVSNTLENKTDGLYTLTYVVGPGDKKADEGQIPISCTLKSPSTGKTVVASGFTDHNMAGVDISSVWNEMAVSSAPGSETISFITVKPTHAHIEYIDGDNTIDTLDDGLGTLHHIAITGLRPGATYMYEIVATDANGQEATSPEQLTFTVAGIDNNPTSLVPPVPTNLTSTAYTDMVDLTWDPISEVAPYHVGYNIFKDGVKLGSASWNVFTDYPLKPGEKHTYSVSAYMYRYDMNLGPNTESAQSIALTTGALDAPAPTLKVAGSTKNTKAAESALSQPIMSGGGGGGGGPAIPTTASPTPSAAPTATPIPSPTPTPSSPPTPSASPTPRATPVRIPVPAPSPVNSPTPSSTPAPTPVPSPSSNPSTS